MLLLISPAKTLNTEPSNLNDFSIPTRLKESEELVKILKKFKKDDLMKLMDVSEKIAATPASWLAEFCDTITLFSPATAPEFLCAMNVSR